MSRSKDVDLPGRLFSDLQAMLSQRFPITVTGGQCLLFIRNNPCWKCRREETNKTARRSSRRQAGSVLGWDFSCLPLRLKQPGPFKALLLGPSPFLFSFGVCTTNSHNGAGSPDLRADEWLIPNPRPCRVSDPGSAKRAKLSHLHNALQ